MKYIITESQYKLLKEQKDIIYIPSMEIFNNDWTLLQKFLEKRGNPPFYIGGNLDLRGTPIESLGNLTSVGGDLDLGGTPIESLGNLTSVGGNLDLYGTPMSKYETDEIRSMVDIEKDIYL
jgi:hypothetical protein